MNLSSNILNFVSFFFGFSPNGKFRCLILSYKMCYSEMK